MKKIYFAFVLFYSISNAQVKILFDATKAEMVGSADWVIDADAHNIFFNSTTHIPYTSNGAGASNPQKIPTPAQSGITASTAETYWDGALSYWAVDCAKKGYIVESLPYNGQITYGNTSNLQDLSNYKVFVIDEPNSLFSAAEKTAIMNFVYNGGGLCMIADHTGSDRNYDGSDSLQVWNDLMNSNTVQTNPFGFSFDSVDISQTTSAVANLPTNPILHGTAGNVTQAKWSNGTTMTLNSAQNSSVLGLIFKTGSSTTGTTNVMVASATFHNGKVVSIGDSSIADDATGDPNDTLYNGYITDANGNHQKLLMNATIWLATPTLNTNSFTAPNINLTVTPNPIQNNELKINFITETEEPIMISISDSLGRVIYNIKFDENELGMNAKTIPLYNLNSGVYFCRITNSEKVACQRFIVK